MIVDQLFEDDDKKKKLNEIDPRNYDSDEDYYNDLYGDEGEDDVDEPEDDWYDDESEPESHYEKHVRVNNLESRLNEFDMPAVGQATGVAAQNDNKPRQTYSVKVVGQISSSPRTFTAETLWLALETVLPRDYPRVPFQRQSGNEPQRRVLDDVYDDGFSIVKQGINSQDIAETIANKFESKGVPAEVIDGGLYEEDAMAPMPEFYAGQEITWRPKFAKMVPVPVTVVAAGPGKLKIKLQSPRMIQNYGKEVIVVNVADSDIMAKQGVAEGKRNKQRKLNEAMLMEDPVYRSFKQVGRYIAERKMSEKEILQVFADAEAGMTDKGTGANRTFLGRGKDTTMDFAGGVADALKGVWSGIQNSVPVAAVDVAYDQATDALANLTGGQKGAVMQAIKKYRMLAKQYPKTAGLAKGALVAITGLATGGAGLPAVAALVYGLDSAIKGEKLSDIAAKAGGAAATAWAGREIASALGGQPADTGSLDPSQFPAYDDDGNLMPGFHINPEDGSAYYDPSIPNEVGGLTEPNTGDAGGIAGQFDGGQYTVQDGDQIGYIAQANGVKTMDIEGLNPQIDFSKPLQKGMVLNLPPQGDGAGSVWDGYTGGNYGDKVAGAAGDTAQGLPSHPSAAGDYGMGGNAPIDYSQPGPISTDSLGQKLEYGMPVSDNGSFIPPNPKLPAEELATQQAAYDAWKSDFMRRFPNATELPDGSMQNIKPGLAPMYPTNYTPGMNTNGLTPKAVQESVKIKKLAFDKLVDKKTTVMSWALNESIGVKSKSVHLSSIGTYTVFENVDRYRKAIMELANVPGSTRPDYYRPDMSGAPVTPDKKPGMIGKGLNWLDKAAGKVGGAISNFGHQFTTGVTKEKLKMNWHQAGKPSDSDQLAAWLVKQGVPQEVVTSVYGKMGIPYTASATTAQPAAEPAATGGLAQKSMPFYGTNPATKKPWTQDELQAKATAGAAAPATQPAAGTFPGEDPTGPNYVGRREVARRQAARDAGAAKTPAKPNFAQQGGGYSSVNYAPNIKTGVSLPKPAAAPAPAATGTKVVSGGPTPDEQAKLAQRIAQAAKQPVAEMLNMVETKEDVQRIKKFIDQTFVKYGAVSESAFAVRNKLIEHVTQVGAQRRREFARKS